MRRLAVCVMVAGTASDVGKSVIATALCRVLAENGVAVAPFKAQNMSLNAAVTVSGGEIGRAQAAQAEAAGIEARVEMNPILLKPEADSRSQVVVLGRATRSLGAREYWDRRRTLWPVVQSALRTLREEFEVIVIEGAGSIAELNLARSDIANLRVARHASARILLVGDIERGGIFAQLLGTLELLGRDRPRVAGLLVNKFRGDPALFEEGARLLRRRGRLPVLGVLPYRPDLGVPAEDALGLRGTPGAIDVAAIRLPHVSNFDDLEPLSADGAAVRWVSDPGELGAPDLVVLPGSKTTIADLAWLRTSGIAARLRALVDAGTPLLGICGGLQMLGAELADPAGVEGRVATVRGLGFLPLRTVFTARKTTVRVSGETCGGAPGIGRGISLAGYEIHVGETARGSGCAPFAAIRRAGSSALIDDGAMSADGSVFGTYVHGLFASDTLRTGVLRELARRKGRTFVAATRPADRYAPLSEWFRAAVDVPLLLRTTGLG